MSEQRRIQEPNILFHVINRGNAKQTVFHDAEDHDLYIELMRRYKLKYAICIYHYVLMSNHVHLMIEPTRPQTISKFMQGLTVSYTRRFNAKYGSVGHVWQSRFRSIPIETDPYYIRCAQYIELNPVRAGMVSHPFEYVWSSYRKSTQTLSPEWLDVHPLLAELQNKQQDNLMIYESLIQQELKKIAERTHESFSRHAIYGGKDFLDRYGAKMNFRTEEELR